MAPVFKMSTLSLYPLHFSHSHVSRGQSGSYLAHFVLQISAPQERDVPEKGFDLEVQAFSKGRRVFFSKARKDWQGEEAKTCFSRLITPWSP